MKNNNQIALSDDVLDQVAGGTCCGGPIMSTCPNCGKDFKSGNAGVNHARYPLKTMCDECAAKVEQQ